MASQFSRLAAALMGSGVLVLSPAVLAQTPETDEAPVYLCLLSPSPRPRDAPN